MSEKRSLKRLPILLLGIISLLFIALNSVSTVSADNRDVLDQSNVINTETESKILNLNKYGMQKIRTRPQIAVMTTESTEPTKKVGIQTFNHYRIGRKGANNGVLLVLNTRQHNYAVIPGKGVARILNANFRHRLMTPKIKSYLVEENYSMASWGMVNIIYNRLGSQQKLIGTTGAEGSIPGNKPIRVVRNHNPGKAILTVLLFISLIGAIGLVGYSLYRFFRLKQEDQRQRQRIIDDLEREKAIDTKEPVSVIKPKVISNDLHEEISRPIHVADSDGNYSTWRQNEYRPQGMHYSQFFGSTRSPEIEQAVQKNIFQRHPYLTGFGGGLLASHLFNRIRSSDWFDYDPFFNTSYPWWAMYQNDFLNDSGDFYGRDDTNFAYDGNNDDSFDGFGGEASNDWIDDDYSDNSWDDDSYDTSSDDFDNTSGYDGSWNNGDTSWNADDSNGSSWDDNDSDGSWDDGSSESGWGFDSSSDNSWDDNSWDDNSWDSGYDDSWDSGDFDSGFDSGGDWGSDDGSW